MAFSTSRLILREYCALSVVTSDNAMAHTILAVVGPERYQALLRAAGCVRADLPSGFLDADMPRLKEALTTVEDQLALLDYPWRVEALAPLREWMANNLRNTRLSAHVDIPWHFAHKTGSFLGVVNDAGVFYRDDVALSVVALCSAEPDSMLTSIAMAELGRHLVALMDSAFPPGTPSRGRRSRSDPEILTSDVNHRT